MVNNKMLKVCIEHYFLERKEEMYGHDVDDEDIVDLCFIANLSFFAALLWEVKFKARIAETRLP